MVSSAVLNVCDRHLSLLFRGNCRTQWLVWLGWKRAHLFLRDNCASYKTSLVTSSAPHYSAWTSFCQTLSSQIINHKRPKTNCIAKTCYENTPLPNLIYILLVTLGIHNAFKCLIGCMFVPVRSVLRREPEHSQLRIESLPNLKHPNQEHWPQADDHELSKEEDYRPRARVAQCESTHLESGSDWPGQGPSNRQVSKQTSEADLY